MTIEVHRQNAPTENIASNEYLERRGPRIEFTYVETRRHDRLRAETEHEIDVVGVDGHRAGRTLD